jgi:hypothetical protein
MTHHHHHYHHHQAQTAKVLEDLVVEVPVKELLELQASAPMAETLPVMSTLGQVLLGQRAQSWTHQYVSASEHGPSSPWMMRGGRATTNTLADQRRKCTMETNSNTFIIPRGGPTPHSHTFVYI